MRQFNIAEAKARFSELVQAALTGEEVVIAKDNKPLLKLVLLQAPLARRVPGSAKGFELLPIEFRHTMAVSSLPFRHRDPFDRLLAAQALEEKLAIVSHDQQFSAYGLKRIG